MLSTHIPVKLLYGYNCNSKSEMDEILYVMNWDATLKGTPSKLLDVNFYSHLVPSQSLVIVLSWKQNEVAGKAQYAPISTTRLVKKQDLLPRFSMQSSPSLP